MSADRLDTLLGDPWDTANPVGHAPVLAADERQEMLAEGERLLDGFGLNAEFVPAAHGGRLTRADRLAETLRTLWRRDPCLGLGYGFSSFIAAVNIWSSGTDDQRRDAARLLLANGRIAAAFHELDHGNDFRHAECTARPAGTGWLLSGRKEIVTNMRRADAMVLFARTSDATGSRSHSQFLTTRANLPADRVRDLPRFPASGMRGVQLGGAEFTDCPLPDGALLGLPGQGMEIALRSYQVTRAVFPAVSVGPLDTALRTTLTCALERRLYGGAVADIPYVRTVIARAYADLLAVDAFSAVVVRALHLAPEPMTVYAPAAKYLTSRMVLDAFEDLRTVLGAQAYLRQGPYAIFQKMARDIEPATFAHVSRAACLVMILPQLPRLARRSWLNDPAAPAQLFDLGTHLPPLRFDRLVAGMPRDDGVIGTLAEIAETPGARPETGPLDRFATRFAQELRALREECLQLPPSALTIDAPPHAFALAGRYTVLLAAASVLATWAQAGTRHPQAALPGVLDRLARRLGGAPVLTEAEREHTERCLYDEAVGRCRNRRLLDLTARRIPG
ncbi:acyl-CoA dehydrogenase [Streptomyces shenzhenensis]|uniref:acyl-CoA dehydrogenase n=1 Tax=Streptomyces shenzhenensis TaxID=943815 RepID=UPI0015F02857|nr:acyl-CoA dehydrogenase [Streptomyces shenzhenensis]